MSLLNIQFLNQIYCEQNFKKQMQKNLNSSPTEEDSYTTEEAVQIDENQYRRSSKTNRRFSEAARMLSESIDGVEVSNKTFQAQSVKVEGGVSQTQIIELIKNYSQQQQIYLNHGYKSKLQEIVTRQDKQKSNLIRLKSQLVDELQNMEKRQEDCKVQSDMMQSHLEKMQKAKEEQEQRYLLNKRHIESTPSIEFYGNKQKAVNTGAHSPVPKSVSQQQSQRSLLTIPTTHTNIQRPSREILGYTLDDFEDQDRPKMIANPSQVDLKSRSSRNRFNQSFMGAQSNNNSQNVHSGYIGTHTQQVPFDISMSKSQRDLEYKTIMQPLTERNEIDDDEDEDCNLDQDEEELDEDSNFAQSQINHTDQIEQNNETSNFNFLMSNLVKEEQLKDDSRIDEQNLIDNIVRQYEQINEEQKFEDDAEHRSRTASQQHFGKTLSDTSMASRKDNPVDMIKIKQLYDQKGKMAVIEEKSKLDKACLELEINIQTQQMKIENADAQLGQIYSHQSELKDVQNQLQISEIFDESQVKDDFKPIYTQINNDVVSQIEKMNKNSSQKLNQQLLVIKNQIKDKILALQDLVQDVKNQHTPILSAWEQEIRNLQDNSQKKQFQIDRLEKEKRQSDQDKEAAKISLERFQKEVQLLYNCLNLGNRQSVTHYNYLGENHVDPTFALECLKQVCNENERLKDELHYVVSEAMKNYYELSKYQQISYHEMDKQYLEEQSLQSEKINTDKIDQKINESVQELKGIQIQQFNENLQSSMKLKEQNNLFFNEIKNATELQGNGTNFIQRYNSILKEARMQFVHDLSSMQKEFKNSRTIFVQMLKEKNDAKGELKGLKSSNIQLKNKIEQANHQVKEMSQIQDGLKVQLQKDVSDIQSLRLQIEKLEQIKETKESQIIKMNDEIKIQQVKLSQNDKEIFELKTDLHRKSQLIQDYQSNVKKLEDENESLEETIQKLNKEIQVLNDQADYGFIEDLIKDIAQWSQECKLYNENYLESQELLNRLTMTMDNPESSASDDRMPFDVVNQAEIAKIIESIAKKTNLFEPTRSKLNDNIFFIDKKIEQYKLKLSALRQAHQKHRPSQKQPASSKNEKSQLKFPTQNTLKLRKFMSEDYDKSNDSSETKTVTEKNKSAIFTEPNFTSINQDLRYRLDQLQTEIYDLEKRNKILSQKANRLDDLKLKHENLQDNFKLLLSRYNPIIEQLTRLQDQHPEIHNILQKISHLQPIQNIETPQVRKASFKKMGSSKQGLGKQSQMAKESYEDDDKLQSLINLTDIERDMDIDSKSNRSLSKFLNSSKDQIKRKDTIKSNNSSSNNAKRQQTFGPSPMKCQYQSILTDTSDLIRTANQETQTDESSSNPNLLTIKDMACFMQSQMNFMENVAASSTTLPDNQANYTNQSLKEINLYSNEQSNFQTRSAEQRLETIKHEQSNDNNESFIRFNINNSVEMGQSEAQGLEPTHQDTQEHLGSQNIFLENQQEEEEQPLNCSTKFLVPSPASEDKYDAQQEATRNKIQDILQDENQLGLPYAPGATANLSRADSHLLSNMDAHTLGLELQTLELNSKALKTQSASAQSFPTSSPYKRTPTGKTDKSDKKFSTVQESQNEQLTSELSAMFYEDDEVEEKNLTNSQSVAQNTQIQEEEETQPPDDVENFFTLNSQENIDVDDQDQNDLLEFEEEMTKQKNSPYLLHRVGTIKEVDEEFESQIASSNIDRKLKDISQNSELISADDLDQRNMEFTSQVSNMQYGSQFGSQIQSYSNSGLHSRKQSNQYSRSGTQ